MACLSLFFDIICKTVNSNGTFSESARLGKKTHCFSNVLPHTVLTHFLLYLAQSHQYRRDPTEPPTKTEIVCWGWWGQGQCQQHCSWPCLIFLLAFFLTFSLAKCTIFPPNSKFWGEWSGHTREFKMISILMHHNFSRTFWELNCTLLCDRLWNLLEIRLCGTISNYCLKKKKSKSLRWDSKRICFN